MVDLQRLFGKLRKPTAIDEITLQRVQQMRTLEPRRRCFADHSGIQMAKKNGSKSFSVKFEETVRPIYEAMTGCQLHYSVKFSNYWHSIDDDENLSKIQQWESSQGDRVFLRDCLSRLFTCNQAQSLPMKHEQSAYCLSMGCTKYGHDYCLPHRLAISHP